MHVTLAKEVQLHFSLDHIHLSLHDQTLGGIKLKGGQLRFALSKGRHTALDSEAQKFRLVLCLPILHAAVSELLNTTSILF